MQQKFDSLSKGKRCGTAAPLARPHVPLSLRALSLPTLAWKLSRCVRARWTDSRTHLVFQYDYSKTSCVGNQYDRMGGYSIGSCRFNIQPSKSKTARVVAHCLGQSAVCRTLATQRDLHFYCTMITYTSSLAGRRGRDSDIFLPRYNLTVL